MKDWVPCGTIFTAAHDVRAVEVEFHIRLNGASFRPSSRCSAGSLRPVLISLPLAPARMDRRDEQRSSVLVVCLEGQENFSANCFARASAVASAI